MGRSVVRNLEKHLNYIQLIQINNDLNLFRDNIYKNKILNQLC